MCDGACYSLKLFGSRWAHYPERGDEWKTGEEAETTRHGPKIQRFFAGGGIYCRIPRFQRRLPPSASSRLGAKA